MTYHSLPPEPTRNHFDTAPVYVRRAAIRSARAYRVLRLYKRRGWNPSAVVTEYTRAREEMATALDRWEHEETNPSLF